MDHILEITQPGTKIRFENELLILDSPEKEAFSVPINETGALLLTHSGVSVSGRFFFVLPSLGSRSFAATSVTFLRGSSCRFANIRVSHVTFWNKLARRHR